MPKIVTMISCLLILCLTVMVPFAQAQEEETVFVENDKEWKTGEKNLTWSESQAWIESLGDGWRAPTSFELKELYEKVGQDSLIGGEFVWAEKEESGMVWRVNFSTGGAGATIVDDRLDRCMAVAVRD